MFSDDLSTNESQVRWLQADSSVLFGGGGRGRRWGLCEICKVSIFKECQIRELP